MKEELNIVWLKRDLRTRDHDALAAAELDNRKYIVLYIFEPTMLSYPDCSLRHLQFIYHSIEDMNQQWRRCERRVHIYHAEGMEVFSSLCTQFDIKNVFSYQESGIRTTWNRDKLVANYFKTQNVNWKQFQRDGIVRGIKNRKLWDRQWHGHVGERIEPIQFSKSSILNIDVSFPIKQELKEKLQEYGQHFQKAGESYAWKYLASFYENRGKNYARFISKPLESRKSCGRISPYLAWGNLSIRQAYQYVRNNSNFESNKRSFNGMLTRLKWHCHFIQKFEVECDYETRCINRGYESMPKANNEQFIDAWKNGKTGFPLVDACMRCLHTTGWINFRMRAMLVSVLCHQLDCDWREGAHHLAQLFLDYEPGIHYPQFQMQAGTTGVNTIRMYNPIKQSKDHDKNGVFIKTWVKELEDFPIEFIHEPWTITAFDLALTNIKTTYPNPIVDLTESARIARDKIWGHRKLASVKVESRRIISVHTRRTKKAKRS